MTEISEPSSSAPVVEAGWSGMETPGMKEAKCSLLLSVDGSFHPKIKSLPDQRVLVHQDKAYNPATTETNSFYVDFPGCTIMQLEPTVGEIPKTMPVTLTVAGKCYFTEENYRDFKTMMRTKEQSEQLNIPPNGCFDWPDVDSLLLCPLCGTVAPVPSETDNDDGEDYWMIFYPLMQITVMKGTKMTLGTRTICRLTCLGCMQGLLDGMTLKVKQEVGPERRKPSMLSFSLSALEILEEAGSASFLQDAPPRPDSHPHVDDDLDAWTLYNLWEHSGAWEALQNDYRIVLSRSMHATSTQPQTSHRISDISNGMEAKGKERYGRKCGNMACKKIHGKKDLDSGEIVRLTIQCHSCEFAFYCSKICRRAASTSHKESCSQRQIERSEQKDKKVKRVQCDTCKKVLPYTQMKKCSRCKHATCKSPREREGAMDRIHISLVFSHIRSYCIPDCGFECQKLDWSRHKLRCVAKVMNE